MISFADLGRPAKALFLTVCFIGLCLSVCLFFQICHRREKWYRAFCLVCCALYCGTMIVIYDAYEKGAFYENWPLHPFAESAAEIPVILPISGVGVALVLIAVIAVWEWGQNKRLITAASVKESIDCLTTGLCFSYPNGIVILVNHRMDALCHQIFGESLQNAVDFWEKICEGRARETAECLSIGAHPMYRLADGSVWTFGREECGDTVQITAGETTRLYMMTEELKNRNLELAAVNLRLRKYAENMDELARAKERLETKARIHGEFGKALLSTRRYLQDYTADVREILTSWKRNVTMLKMATPASGEEDPMRMLMKVAESSGVEVLLDGEIPEEKAIRQLFFDASSEALTNAVAHADAKRLHIVFECTGAKAFACFTNDGKSPSHIITEGGGLNALRQKTERMGGEMRIETENGFELFLSVPLERGEKS